MLDVHSSRVGTKGLRLPLRAVLEYMTRNKDTRDAEHFKVQRVVHTARRAAPSIGQCFDNRLALLCDLAAHIHRGRFRKGRLLVTTNLGPLFTEALFQPMRISGRLYELGVIGDESSGNSVFQPQSPVALARLHGGVYGIVNPALPPVSAPPLAPVRAGDRMPEDTNYFRLDATEYPRLLEQLANETRATVVKLWVRGRTSQGDVSFASDADVHAFNARALARS